MAQGQHASFISPAPPVEKFDRIASNRLCPDASKTRWASTLETRSKREVDRNSKHAAIPVNRWRIPAWLEREVVERDKSCIYCRTPFGVGTSKGSFASWEHIINDARIITRENIALCCRSCNSSKGAKTLSAWLESAYCRRGGISAETVADIAKQALKQASSV